MSWDPPNARFLSIMVATPYGMRSWRLTEHTWTEHYSPADWLPCSFWDWHLRTSSGYPLEDLAQALAPGTHYWLELPEGRFTGLTVPPFGRAVCTAQRLPEKFWYTLTIPLAGFDAVADLERRLEDVHEWAHEAIPVGKVCIDCGWEKVAC